MDKIEKIDCTTCKYGYEDERLGIPMCHHPKRFSEDCIDFNLHEEKHQEMSKKEQTILEDAAKHYAYIDWSSDEDIFAFEIKKYDAFKAGAEWQKEQDMDEWLKDRDGCFWDGVEEGKKAMEDQMLKDAVEAVVTTNLANRPVIYLDQLQGFQYGDKVRVIIIKED